MTDTTSPAAASVILPARTDSRGLRLALEALERQTFAGDYEIVVISPDTIDVVSYPRARLVRDSGDGPGAALNAGVSAACGDILALTDVDCVPEPGWLDTGVAYIQAMQRPGIVAGRIVQTARDAEHPNAIETFEVESSLRQDEDARHGVASASNLFVSRDVFSAAGMFREDMKAKSDWEFCLRALEAGNSLVYCHEAAVSHGVIWTWTRLIRSKMRLAHGMLDLGNARGLFRGEMRREALAELRLPVRTMCGRCCRGGNWRRASGSLPRSWVARWSYAAGWVLAEARSR